MSKPNVSAYGTLRGQKPGAAADVGETTDSLVGGFSQQQAVDGRVGFQGWIEAGHLAEEFTLSLRGFRVEDALPECARTGVRVCVEIGAIVDAESR